MIVSQVEWILWPWRVLWASLMIGIAFTLLIDGR